MKTILVATDFSFAALNAANYAADMALAIDADIVLLHTYQIPIGFSEVPVIIDSNEMKANAENDIDEVRKHLLRAKGSNLNITTEVVMGGFFNELENYCKKLQPYTVIIGCKGGTVSELFLFGSNAIYAMKHLNYPLITVPLTASFSSIKKIGLACDYDKVVDTIPVDEIKQLVNDFKAELLVLNTGKEEVFDPEIVFQSGLLQEMLMSLNPSYHYIETENVDDGILEFADKQDIDLLIVFPKRHNLLEQLIHKSHTKQFVLHSHIPVMSLHNELHQHEKSVPFSL